MKKFMKRTTALFLSLIMLVMTLTGCGKEKNRNVNNEIDTTGYITRGEWIDMLADTFGYDEYDQETAYYSDVKSDSEVFTAVQSCRERNMLSTETDEFKVNDVATMGFVATTAVLASGVDYTKYAEGTSNENEAIIKCAKETGICPDIVMNDNGLRQGVDEVYASTVLSAAQGLFLAYTGEEKMDINYAEAVIDNFEDSSVKIDEKGNLTMEDTADIGSIIICPPSEEYPNGHAVKVVAVESDDEGNAVYKTEEADFAEVYESVDIATVVEATPDCFYPAEGVTVIKDDTAQGEQTAFIDNAEFEAIDTSTNASAIQTISGDFSKSKETVIKVDLKNGNVKATNTDEDKIQATIFGKNLELKEKYEETLTEEEKEKKKLWEKSKEFQSLASKKADKIVEDYKSGKISKDDFISQMKKFQKDNGVEKGSLRPLTLKGDFDAGWNLTGTIKINLAVAAAANVKIEWFLNPKVKSYSIDVTNKIESSLTLEGKCEGEVQLGKFAIPVYAGASVDVALIAKIEANGKITVKAVITNEQKVEYKDGKTTKTNKSSFNKDLEVDASIELAVGLKVSISLLSFNIVDGEITAAIKLEVKAKAGRDISLEESISDDGTACLKYEDALVLRHEESIMAPIVKLTIGTKKSLVGKLGISFSIDFISEDDIKKSNKYLYLHNESEIKFLIDSKIIELVEDETKEEETTAIEESTTEEELTTEVDNSEIGVLSLNDFAIDIKVGDQYQLKVVKMPKGYEDDVVVWTSEDNSIATISSKGIINAVNEGTISVYGKTSDGKYIGKCTVLVRK